MAKWDMRKTEKITPLFDDNDLKEDVSRLEKKVLYLQDKKLFPCILIRILNMKWKKE